MYPILYKADAIPSDHAIGTNPNAKLPEHMGLGSLSDCISCDVIEERNGLFEMSVIYPVNGLHYEEIAEGMLLKAKPNDIDKPQFFRIYGISKPFNNQVEILAEHISYELNNYPVTPSIPGWVINYSAEGLWSYFANGWTSTQPNYTPKIPVNGAFSFSTSGISGTKEYHLESVKSLRALLGGDENSFLDLWNGEYKFDNYAISFMANRGEDRGVTIKYGKNMTDLTQDISLENMYTHIMPYAKKTEYQEVTETDPDTQEAVTRTVEKESWVYATENTGDWTNGIVALKDTDNTTYLESKYGFKKVKMLDLTDVFDSDYNTQPSDVKDKCLDYISTNSEIKRPKVTLTVKFQPYDAIDPNGIVAKLEKVGLCDLVRVVHPKYGIDEKLKVNKTVFNVLIEKYKSVEIGDAKSNFADTLRDEYN